MPHVPRVPVHTNTSPNPESWRDNGSIGLYSVQAEFLTLFSHNFFNPCGIRSHGPCC
jgi:hypothetical protein